MKYRIGTGYCTTLAMADSKKNAKKIARMLSMDNARFIVWVHTDDSIIAKYRLGTRLG